MVASSRQPVLQSLVVIRHQGSSPFQDAFRLFGWDNASVVNGVIVRLVTYVTHLDVANSARHKLVPAGVRSILRAHLDLRSQFFVSESFVSDGRDEGIESQESVAFHTPRVQPEGKFVNVSFGVLFADMVKDAVDAALEDRPNRLDSVGIDRAVREVSRTVIDRAVPKEQAIKPGVAGVLVAVDCRTDFDVIEKALLDRAKVRTVQHKRLCIAAALSHSENRSLAYRSASHVQLFVRVLVDLFAANESLVNFYDAAQLINIFSASLAQSVKHEPSRLLSDADLLCQLQGRDSLAGSDQEIHRVNPLVQGNVRPFKDRARPDREILLAGVAAIEAALASRNAFRAFADRTDNAIRPQAGFQIETSRYRVGNHLEQLKGADCAFAHEQNLPRIRRGSQVYSSLI